MTALISNLEDWLENISDDEMQWIRGGVDLSSDVYSSETSKTPKNRRTGTIVEDIAVGAASCLIALMTAGGECDRPPPIRCSCSCPPLPVSPAYKKDTELYNLQELTLPTLIILKPLSGNGFTCYFAAGHSFAISKSTGADSGNGSGLSIFPETVPIFVFLNSRTINS